ncbi:MAG: PhzF family phenazine biosynthesis protein [Deltaproteobacteria bacterium HGW-Deltaproteobacteria-12]|jgi:PhzF family phenazine biosynthesis protein|nr:MAG: PhzF family phenazine biosynthesis protein [Deltaproteobacteria bacterium HGW-Deltaproteobacteria-12]
MKSFPFKKIDAFTKGKSCGNPCAVIYLSGTNDISDQQMQLIARELKGFVNEVVYVFPEEKRFFLKYYSAECEVDFCGHGTIGTMYDLIGSREDLLNQESIEIRVKDTHLSVYNRIKKSDSVFITAPPPVYNDLQLHPEAIAGALHISVDDINKNFQLALINAGLNTLLVPVKDLKLCLTMQPHQMELKKFCLEQGIDIILVFTAEVAEKKNKFRTRVFAPKFGYLEDPATGSGNSAFGNYLLQNNLWDGSLLSIEQNNSYDFHNIIKLDTVIKKESKNVIFGGAAMVKIDGLYKIN